MPQNCQTFVFTIILIVTLSSNTLLGQSVKGSDEGATENTVWRFGSEVDVLPYIMDGYYASAFIGHEAWRLRAVTARSAAPDFLVTSGFENKRTDAYALLADRFLGPRRGQLKGFWVGGGGEFWQSRIRRDNTSSFTQFDNFVLTAGGGYVWKLSKHFYLNPWSAMHVVVAGDRNINVSGKMYHQPAVTPEASLKIGFVF